MNRFARFALRTCPESGVAGVAGVAGAGNPSISAIFSASLTATPSPEKVLQGVADTGAATPSENRCCTESVAVFHSENSKLGGGATLATPATPFFDDVRDAFEERAAIVQHDGGLTRPEAESAARFEIDPEGEVMRQWFTETVRAIEADPFALMDGFADTVLGVMP